MNKKIYIVFIPVLLLIFIVNGRADYVGVNGVDGAGYSISNGYKPHNPNSVNLQKENDRKPQNVFRIKAKYNGGTIIVARYWSVVLNVYYTKPAHYCYSADIFSPRFYRHELRGPPAA